MSTDYTPLYDAESESEYIMVPAYACVYCGVTVAFTVEYSDHPVDDTGADKCPEGFPHHEVSWRSEAIDERRMYLY